LTERAACGPVAPMSWFRGRETVNRTGGRQNPLVTQLAPQSRHSIPGRAPTPSMKAGASAAASFSPLMQKRVQRCRVGLPVARLELRLEQVLLVPRPLGLRPGSPRARPTGPAAGQRSARTIEEKPGLWPLSRSGALRTSMFRRFDLWLRVERGMRSARPTALPPIRRIHCRQSISGAH